MTQETEPKKSAVFGIPQVWWVPIVVALIGLVGIIIPFVNNNDPSKPFTYLVRVQKEGTSQNISNAKVTIEVPGLAPLDEITDSNGVARFSINASYAGQPGRLLIKADGYESHRQELDLTDDSLPDTIALKQQIDLREDTFLSHREESGAISITPTPTKTSTPIPTEIPTEETILTTPDTPLTDPDVFTCAIFSFGSYLPIVQIVQDKLDEQNGFKLEIIPLYLPTPDHEYDIPYLVMYLNNADKSLAGQKA